MEGTNLITNQDKIIDEQQETKHKSTLQVSLICLNASLGCFFWGYIQTVQNPAQDYINTLFNLNPSEQNLYDGYISSLVQLGGAIGAILCGIFAPILGRRYLCIVLDVLSIIGMLLSLINNLLCFLLARLICGIAVGLNSTIVPIYISEMSPLQLSGKMGSLTQNAINIGEFMSFILGLYLPTNLKTQQDSYHIYFRFMIVFPIITCLIRLFNFCYLYNFDTPFQYVYENKESKARQILNMIYKEEYVDEVYNEIEKKIQYINKQSYSQLLSYKYKSRFIVGIMLGFIQMIGGINCIMFYSTEIVKSSENDLNNRDNIAKIFTCIYGLCLVVGTWLSGFLIDKFGRKVILLIGVSIDTLVLMIMTIFGYLDQSSPQKYLLILYVFGFGLSLGPIVWLYIPEILPAKGVSIAALGLWIMSALMTFIFPTLMGLLQIKGCFLLFSLTSLFSLIYILIFVQETKGKTEIEIAKSFGVYQSQQLLLDLSSSLNPIN